MKWKGELIMMKKLTAFLAVFAFSLLVSVAAEPVKKYDIPGFRIIGGIKVLLAPDETGQEVTFFFEKQDLNGYAGSDEVALKLLSPGGETVWETVVPDDGDTRKHWKPGPKQPVTCRFVPKEAGIYTMTAKAGNGNDILLHFGRSESKGCAWAVSAQKLRSDHGKLHAWLLMPVLKAGEKPDQPIKLTGAKFTRLSGLTVKAGENELIKDYTMPKYVKSSNQVNTHQIMLKRPAGTALFELDSGNFTEVVAVELPQYGPVMLTAEKALAQKMLPFIAKPVKPVSKAEYRLPDLRLTGRTTLMIIPDQVGKEVCLTFGKKDLNGYIGSDMAVFTLLSPSGKAVWEQAVPDDGNTTSNWKPGPVQPVICRFVPKESGLYTMEINTNSGLDIVISFDRTTSSGCAWAVSSSNLRSGSGRLHAWLLLPPLKPGETRERQLSLLVSRHSMIRNLTVKADGKALTESFTMPPFTNAKPSLINFHISVTRPAKTNVFELDSDEFNGVVSFKLPQYSGPIILAPDRAAGEKFLPVMGDIRNQLLTELPGGKEIAGAAFAPGKSYQFLLIPEKADQDFRHQVTLFGNKYELTGPVPAFSFTVPEDQPYTDMDLKNLPKGKILVILQNSGAVRPLFPESGKTLYQPETLIWQPNLNAGEYTVRFSSLSSDKTLSVTSKVNRFEGKNYYSKLVPGTWKWQVKTADGEWGPEALLTIPQKADTDTGYYYDAFPVRDGALETVPQEISVRVQGISAKSLDLARSHAEVNGAKIPLGVLADDKIGVKTVPELKKGYNAVRFRMTGTNGTYSEYTWGFFYQTPASGSVSHGKDGYIRFNGLPFFPVIYYGYTYHGAKGQLNQLGFNTLLGNTLPTAKLLDSNLQKNVKLLDSGSVFYGIYSKGSTPEADIRKFAATELARHPARLGAWMDEIDVHRPAEKIKELLDCFGAPENSWRGVCSCRRDLYDSMAGMGDYLMIDYYASGRNLFSTDNAFEFGKKAAGKKPLLVLLVGFYRTDPKVSGFTPSISDARYAAFAALRMKINAIGLYQCGQFRMENYPEVWTEAKKLYKQVSSLTFITEGKDLSGQVKISGSPALKHLALEYADRLYIIAQNASFEAAAANFTIPGKYRGQIQVLFENRLVENRGGKFTDSFSSAATHVYCIPVK